MIRRTLINRAQRQRDLARMLIARHSMIAYDHSQPQLGYRPAASSDDSFAFVSSAEPAAPALYEIAPPADELADPFAAWHESPTAGAPTLFDPAQPPAPAPTQRAMTEEPAHDVPDATEPVSASAQPAAAPDQRPGNTLADLVRRMREPGWVPPQAAPAPATTPQALTPAEPTANEQIADLVRRMREPGWVPPQAAAPATTPQALTPAEPTANEQIADLVRRMREPGWVPPQAAAPATTPQALAPAEPIANEQIADLVRRMQKPPQRTTPKAERPRIPLGQRMSEAADFGQTPTSLHHVDPVTAPAQDERPAEAAERQPEQVVFETEHPAADRAGDDVAHPPEPIAPVESLGRQPIIAGADAETTARRSTSSEEPHTVAAHPDAPAPNPSAPLDKATPPAAPRALSQMPGTDATPARATAIPPSQEPAAEITNRLQNPDAPMALPASATGDLRAPADIPPALTNDLGRPAADVDLVDQIDAAGRRVTPTLAESRQPINLPPAQPSDAHTQSAQATLAAAAHATVLIGSDRPAAAVTPPLPRQPKPSTQAQASLDTRDSRGATTDRPLPPADRTPAPRVAATPARHAPTWPIESESQRSSSEANMLAAPAQALDAPALDTAGTRSAPSEIAQESQPASIRQLESSMPQVQSPSPPAQSAQQAALPSAPTSSAGEEPTADHQSISDARAPQMEHTGAHQGTSESAPVAPDHDSPQAWAARLLRADQPVSAPIADNERRASAPNVVQQPASDPSKRVGSQFDLNLSAAESSADVPIAEHDRVAPAHDYVQALDQHATDTVLAEHALALNQPLHVPQPDAAPTRIGMAIPGKREPVAKAAETPLARSSDLAKEPDAITTANEPGVTRDFARHRPATEVAPGAPAAGHPPAGTEASSPSPQVDGWRNAPAPRFQSPAQKQTPQPNDPSQIAVERAPAPTAAVPFDPEPRSALPSPDRRSSIIRDVPVAADDVPAADPPEPGTPSVWAARLATDRQAMEPQLEPTTASMPAAMPIGRPAAQAAPATDVPAAAPAPGSPQAWAARLAFHHRVTTPQAEPTAVRARAALLADQAPVAPIEPQVLRAAPGRLATAIADPTPGTPARFIPARRADLGAVSAVPADTRAATTERSPVAPDATTAAADVPAVAVSEPGSPPAWVARLITDRQATEPRSEPTIEPTPAMPVGADATAPAPDSPQAWAARLFPQAQSASPQLPPNAVQRSAPPIAHQNVPAAPPTAAQSPPPAQLHRAPDNQPQMALRRAVPTPTAETTRRFLQPLVGIDPAEVRVFRGPVAGQVTAAYRADALASGDTVALAAEHSEDTPATLGVLAHELTHIARQRDSRFVPPLVRRESISGAADEESLAQSVESQVRRIARGQAEATWRAVAPSAAASRSAVHASVPIAAPAQPPPADRDAAIAGAPRVAPNTQSIAHGADWGGLPAPWESLPEWLDTPKQAQMPAPAVPQPTRSAPPVPPAATRNASPGAPRVQLAETGRTLDALPAQSSPAAGPAQQPAPDLDALARQVYAVLKQRLAAERRRSQS